MTDQKVLEFSNMMWAYRTTVKQTDVGGGTVALLVEANERTVILYGVTGPNDYAANRTVDVRLEDGTDLLNILMSNAAVDNVRFYFPTGDHSTVTNDDGIEFHKRIVLGSGDQIRARAITLAQNEELTITIRGLIGTKIPTITTAGSAGTVTLTEVYNKVI